jgi:hypothetical protein
MEADRMIGWISGAGAATPVRFRQAVLLAALLPAACAAPAPPANPFVGAWNTPERQQIAFRDDTVVMTPPGTPPTPLNAAVCDGRFRFAYERKSREALLAAAPQQPELRRRLAAQLPGPEYRVAELTCGDGGTTYVLLGEHDLLAIHHDRDIAAFERLSR